MEFYILRGPALNVVLHSMEFYILRGPALNVVLHSTELYILRGPALNGVLNSRWFCMQWNLLAMELCIQGGYQHFRSSVKLRQPKVSSRMLYKKPAPATGITQFFQTGN